jgi:hypothetical protein
MFLDSPKKNRGIRKTFFNEPVHTTVVDGWWRLYLAVLMNASSTLAAVLAEVSMKMRPCSRAKASPSSRFTSLRASRSLHHTIVHFLL